MDTLYPIAAGIDVHRDTLVVSIRKRDDRSKEKVETRTFETFHDALVEMVAWLDEEDVPIVGLESTGVYWKPAVRALQSLSPKRTVWLVNPLEVKQVPGRKTDVNDSQWLSKLVMHGLVSPSFLPPAQLEELRKLTRFRRTFTSARTSQKNRIIKELETAGIKLAAVCSDPLGKSGRAMIEALVEGTRSPAQIADLALGTLRKKLAELERAVNAPLSSSDRIILQALMRQLKNTEGEIEKLDEQIRAMLAPHQKQAALLETVPGIDAVIGSAVLAEIGPDMSVFDSAKHISAWGGLCPGSNESGGKTKHAPARKGDKYLRTALVQAAWCAVRKKGCPWRDKFGALCKRMGPKKAIIAIARKMLVAIYYMLRDDVPYRPADPAEISAEQRKRKAQRHLQALTELGLLVTVNERAAA